MVQETLHFDPASGRLSALRSKEEAHDYRYFPEPDLVPLAPTEEMLAAARAAIPELPAAREARFASELSLTPRAPASSPTGPSWRVLRGGPRGRRGRAPALANWVRNELLARLGTDADPGESRVTPGALAELVELVSRHGSATAPPSRCSTASWPTGAPGRSWSARAWAPWRATGS